MTLRIEVLLRPPLANSGTSYTCGQIARGMAQAEVEVSVVTPRNRGVMLAPAAVVEILPRCTGIMPYRLLRPFAAHRLETTFVERLSRSEGTRAAYIWADARVSTLKALRRRGIPIFREMINGPRGAAKHILDEAYRSIGVEPCHTITKQSAEDEHAALREADFVFCANACVEQSVAQCGVAPERIVSASYGWDPQRFKGGGRMLGPAQGLTALFVGLIAVRKGVHLLLDAWARSGVRGRLVLVGTMEAAVQRRCAPLLSRPDVFVFPYAQDIGAAYRSADVFVFPTLEEGGPQVTYEACGCGLPVITTPMGAGRIVRHGHEGLVLDPQDRSGWVDAFRTMAEDHERRRAMADRAIRRARLFTWDVVAERRRQQVIQRLAGSGAPLPRAEHAAWREAAEPEQEPA